MGKLDILQLQISYSVYVLKIIMNLVSSRQCYCNNKQAFWPTLYTVSGNRGITLTYLEIVS